MKPLFAIRDVLQKQDMASASQMAAELKLFVGLVEDMLAYWQRRGAVEQVSVGTRKSCGSSCSSGGCGRERAVTTAQPAVPRTWRQP